MNPFDRLPQAAAEVFGEEATAQEAYGLLTVDVPAAAWTTALETARDQLGCTYFDWLSAVDEPGTGFRVCAHVVALPGAAGEGVRRLVLRTTVPHEAPELPTATGVYAGAAWHERETHEMFGIGFTGHPHLVPLLLPEGFEGHPLRKDFVLAARVAKAWPGAKEPGEPAAGAAHGGPKRRQMLPPGVPDPNEWGPLKGQLPPAPARPGRAPRAAGAGAGAAGERPARRSRSVAEGSASQQPAAAPPARRARSVAQGSASQRGAAAEGTAEGSAAGAPEGQPAAPEPPAPRKRTSDAPWNQPRQTAPEPKPEAADDARPTPEGAASGAAPPEGAVPNAAAPGGAAPDAAASEGAVPNAAAPPEGVEPPEGVAPEGGAAHEAERTPEPAARPQRTTARAVEPSAGAVEPSAGAVEPSVDAAEPPAGQPAADAAPQADAPASGEAASHPVDQPEPAAGEPAGDVPADSPGGGDPTGTEGGEAE